MTVHDPDHSQPYQPRHHDLGDADGCTASVPPSVAQPPLLRQDGIVAQAPVFVACCNCLLEYRFLPGLRCPRCGADHTYSVPRHDFFPVPAAPMRGVSSHGVDDDFEADSAGKRLLYVGVVVCMGITIMALFTSGWAWALARQFTDEPSIETIVWIKRGGFIFGAVFTIRAMASVAGWKSGRFFYRNYQFRKRG